jgi:two-component system OmpR family sensor kinase
VRIALRGGAGGVALSVTDEGPGIAPQLRDRVFESYYRIPGSPGDGSGLGLAIVREIAAQHGARVAIGTGEDGRGTCVTVSFPP